MAEQLVLSPDLQGSRVEVVELPFEKPSFTETISKLCEEMPFLKYVGRLSTDGSLFSFSYRDVRIRINSNGISCNGVILFGEGYDFLKSEITSHLAARFRNETPGVGDYVMITKSDVDWVEVEMDRFVGMILKVDEIVNNRANFQGYGDRMGGFGWKFVHGHFTKVFGKVEKTSVKQDVSPLVLSDSFTNLLRSVQSNSKVARLLLRCYELKDFKLIDRVITTEFVNYLTYRPGFAEVSYLPTGKDLIVNDDGTWSKSNRQAGKPSKVIRKLFSPIALRCLFTEKDFEIFANVLVASITQGVYEFEVVSNKKIPSIYSEPELLNENGSLGSSCMNGANPDYFEMYAECEQLSMIVLREKETGRLAGRALLWKNVNVTNSVVDGEMQITSIDFMDRVYVSEDHFYPMFISYAIENGYWRKRDHSSREYKNGLLSPTNVEHMVNMRVKTATDFSSYPYIDTFRYGNDGVLYNNDSQHHQHTYDETNGTRSGDGTTDDITGDTIDEDDAVEIDRGRYRGSITHYHNTVTIDGDRWWIDDGDIIYCDKGSQRDEYILRENAVRVDNYVYHEDDVESC